MRNNYMSGNLVEFIPDIDSTRTTKICVVCGADDLYNQVRVFELGKDIKHSQWIDEANIHPVAVSEYWLEKLQFNFIKQTTVGKLYEKSGFRIIVRYEGCLSSYMTYNTFDFGCVYFIHQVQNLFEYIHDTKLTIK